MPELPEVESFKKVVDDHAIGKQIDVVKILAPNMLQNVSERKLKSTLAGNVFQGTTRHGKFLFINLKKAEICYCTLALLAMLLLLIPESLRHPDLRWRATSMMTHHFFSPILENSEKSVSSTILKSSLRGGTTERMP